MVGNETFILEDSIHLVFCELKKDCHDPTGPNLLNTSVHGADRLRTAT